MTSTNNFAKRFVGASVLALASAGSLAWSQVETVVTEADEAEAVEVQDEVSVQNTIVTVGRRVTTLQDYAGTAAAISGEDLKTLGLVSVEDLDGQIPGLSVANNQGNVEVWIRGVGSSNNTELGDPAAATHMNDVYVPRPSGFGAAFFDIERVEVNIGPQGTLRGRNATAGSVNIIPWKPGLGTTDGMLEVGVGNYNELRLEGVANIAVTDNSAFRIAAFAVEHDSYLESVTPNSSELGLNVPTSEDEGIGVAEAADDFGIRAAYLIEPTDRLRLTLTADYLEQKGTGYTGVNYANALGNGIDPDDIDNPRKVYGRAFTPEEDTEHWGIKAHVEWDGDLFNAEYIGSFRDLVYDYDFVTPASVDYPGALDNLTPFDRTFDNFSRVNFITDSESTIHELRLFSDEGDKLYWTAGAFYFEEKQRTFLGTTGDRNPFFYGVEFNQFTDTESYSFYGDATYSVNDKFRVTGGIRYTDDHKERFGVNARYGQTFIIGGDGFGCCFAPPVGTEGFQFAGFDRTIFNPDTDNDNQLSAQEVIDFYFDGVATFGARDGLDNIYANGEVVDPIPFGERPICPEGLVGFDGTSNGSCFTQATADAFDPAVFSDLVGRTSFAVAVPDLTSIALQNGSLDNNFTDGRFRLEYDISDDNLLYGLIATGNKSGGFNDNIPELSSAQVEISPAGGAPAEFATDSIAPTYGPETLTLYEIGSKNSFYVDGRPATFNVSAFYYDYSDLQLTTLLSVAQIAEFVGADVPSNTGGNIVAFTFNASDAEIYGAQVEGSLDLPWDMNLKGTLLWLSEAKVVQSQEIQDARYQADIDPGNAVNRSIEGNRLPRTPEVQFNASISKVWYTDVGQFDGVFSAGYRSKANSTIFNGIDYDPNDGETDAGRLNDEIGNFWTFDAGAGFSPENWENWRLEAYISNVTNVQEPQAIIITQFDNTRFFNRPRTYGARLRVNF
ncbi:MAG: TonB-dependent receptor [Henriciella sp.]|nr:TonB-dependent receptor [Henriciella sp.]